jgi:hypothetical protein
VFLLAAALGLQDAKPLVTFPKDSIGIERWMKQNGWESKRNDPKRFEVGGGALRLVSRNDSVMIGTERGFPIRAQDRPRLRLKLRVTETPRGTNLAKKSGDDAAFRLYVAFDRGGGLLSPPDSIAYTWTENVEPGTVIASAHYDNLHYVSIGKGTTPGSDWATVERDVAADYASIFKRPAPALRGIMLKCDSNDTETSAESRLAAVELLAPAGP